MACQREIYVAGNRFGPNWHVRSLLSGEALEDDLGVAVDAQVLNGLGVRGRRAAVGAVGDVAERSRAHRSPGNGLHDETGGERTMDSKTLHLQRLARGNGLRYSRLDELQLARRKASSEQETELGALSGAPGLRQVSFSGKSHASGLQPFHLALRRRGSWSRRLPVGDAGGWGAQG